MINRLPWTNSAQNITEMQPKSSIIWSYPAHFLSLSSKNFLKNPLQKKLFCFLIIYFGKRKPRKIQYISRNRTFLYFKKRKPWKTAYILGSNFLSSKRTLWKSFLYFGEWSFLAPSLKALTFQEGTCKDWKIKNFRFFVCWERTFQT